MVAKSACRGHFTPISRHARRADPRLARYQLLGSRKLADSLHVAVIQRLRMNDQKVIPEFDVTDLDESLEFYTSVIGFGVRHQRPEERFCFLDLDGAQLMLEEAAGPGRRLRTAPLERPLGRGMHLQIAVEDVDSMYQRVVESGATIVVPLEERWYRIGDHDAGNRQFVVADPDGYLLRPFQDLGRR
jgi:catechol 2,3-dioxygenase-like lactoylglutathione lyase family enzyme